MPQGPYNPFATPAAVNQVGRGQPTLNASTTGSPAATMSRQPAKPPSLGDWLHARAEARKPKAPSVEATILNALRSQLKVMEQKRGASTLLTSDGGLLGDDQSSIASSVLLGY